jgi:glycosyltransferase involved in cell wall biosynthesis
VRSVPSTDILVNARSLSASITGVQRYADELCKRLDGRIVRISPGRPMHGPVGHLWEQLCLPRLAAGRVLWSPANAGPVSFERQVVTFHDIAVLDHPEWFGKRFAAWYRWLVPRLARRVKRIVAVSEFTKSRLVDALGVDASKIAVIPNGVDERFSHASRSECCELRRRLPVPRSAYVLSVGSLEPRKNLGRLLEAWSQCVDHIPPSVWLVISGIKGASQVFRNAPAMSLPRRVHLTGYVPESELPALYRGALTLVYPSVYEGFGLPALEAMASGVPPIVGDNTSLPEIVSDAGLWIDPHNVEAIAEAITRMVNDVDLREELSRRSLARSRLFDWNNTARATWNVLSEVR